MPMDEIPGGFWQPVAEGFIQRQIKKPFFGRAYLVFGECFSLWAYMTEMAGILAAKQSATISERLPCLPQAGDRAVFGLRCWRERA